MGEAKVGESRWSTNSTTVVGLTLALVAPVLYNLAGPRINTAGTDPVVPTLMGLSAMWLFAAGVIILVTHGEKRSLASIGWLWLPRAMVLQALGIGVLLSLAVPILSIVASSILPSGDTGSIAGIAQFPWWLVLMSVITAGITEEILFRGYALERLLEWSGSKWLSSLITLTFFTLVHAGGWNLAHIVMVVLPLGAILTGLYWWRRNLVLVMIVHTTINLPLVFVAFGQS